MHGSVWVPIALAGSENFIPPQFYSGFGGFFHEPVFIFVFVAFFAFFLMLWVRPFWQLFRSVPGGKTFQFRIVDYWAAMLGLVPTFILISDAIRTPLEPTLFAAGVVAISQLGGIFIGRVHNV